MKPSQSPSLRQILVYDVSSQRFLIYSLFIGIPSLGLLLYGLVSGASNYAWIGLAGILFALFEAARFFQRFRFFQKIHENGESIRITLEDVTQHGDEINAGGQYIYKEREYWFWTTLQKTGRTKDLAIGDQIWLVIDREHPENTYVQDLFTPDAPEEIRQPYVPDSAYEKRQAIVQEDAPQRIKVKVRETETRSPVPVGGAMGISSRQLTIRDFPVSFLVIGALLLLGGILLYVFANEGKDGAIFAAVLGLVIILSTLASTLTIAVDKDAGSMSIKSIWRRDAVEIPLKDLADIQVEVSESDEGGNTYRLVAVKTDGTVIPFRNSYTSGFSSYEKRALQLCRFIGISGAKR